MNREIVPGCLCLIVNSAACNEGKVVTAVEFVGEVLGFEGADRWLIDRPINTAFHLYGPTTMFARESQLLRIDGNDDIETMCDSSVEVKA